MRVTREELKEGEEWRWNDVGIGWIAWNWYQWNIFWWVDEWRTRIGIGGVLQWYGMQLIAIFGRKEKKKLK